MKLVCEHLHRPEMGQASEAGVVGPLTTGGHGPPRNRGSWENVAQFNNSIPRLSVKTFKYGPALFLYHLVHGLAQDVQKVVGGLAEGTLGAQQAGGVRDTPAVDLQGLKIAIGVLSLVDHG